MKTVGTQDAPMAVHLTLLGADVILLEGIRLSEVSEGVYFLIPIRLCVPGQNPRIKNLIQRINTQRCSEMGGSPILIYKGDTSMV